MNATHYELPAGEENDHLQLDFVLNKLYKSVKGLNTNVVQEVIIAYEAMGPEDLPAYLYSSELLKEKKIIETYKNHSSGQEEMEDDADEHGYIHRETIYFRKVKYKLKPKILIKYMEDTSRLPKYTLALNKQRQLILNNKYLLNTFQLNSQNLYFFDYVLRHPEETIEKSTMERETGKIKARFQSFLETMIDSELKRVFFPIRSETVIKFRNEIKVKDLKGENIKEKKIDGFLRKLTKIPENI
jgi:hypothetical protein